MIQVLATIADRFRHLAGKKYAQNAMKSRAKRHANHLDPLRDGSEKNEGFPSRARPATAISLQMIAAQSERPRAP